MPNLGGSRVVRDGKPVVKAPVVEPKKTPAKPVAKDKEPQRG